MSTPFPGMDPYLEHPALWPDVHNSLIAAIRDEIVPLVAPRYYVALEERTAVIDEGSFDLVFAGRPDVAIVRDAERPPAIPSISAGHPAVVEVEVPLGDELTETFLEVRDARDHQVVTVLEVISPTNKIHPAGREEYEQKRRRFFRTRTNVVEIDLLRAGKPLSVVGDPPKSDYRVLVSRGIRRPHAELILFGVRDPIPDVSLPLLPEDEEPTIPLGRSLYQLYDRARFDLRIDYEIPPVPPLEGGDAAWARGVIGSRAARE